MLLIAEELLLLGLDDESGKLSSFSVPYLNFTLAGALLMELAIDKKISFVEEGKRKIIIQIDDSSELSDNLLNEALQLMVKYEKKRKIEKMIGILAKHYSEFRKQLFSRLVTQGILERIEKKRLKIFKYVRHPMIKPEIKEEILINIQKVILEDETPTERITSLLALIGASEMIKAVFAKEFRKEAKKKIKAIVESDVIGKYIKRIIQSVQAALIAVIIASTVATTAAH
jgi:golgi phosphoprotein 3